MPGIKPFLILQLRPEDEAADNELEAFLKFGDIKAGDVIRVRMDRESIPDVKLADLSGVIVGGGPYGVSDSEDKKPAEQIRFERELFSLLGSVVENDFPYLGACYGIGVLATYLGGNVSKERFGETLEAVCISLTDAGQKDPLTHDLPVGFKAFVGHKEACQQVPPAATLLGSSPGCPIHMIRVKRNIYATQFHAELDAQGLKLRINIYRHAGYFPPEDAEMLIAAAENESVTVPEQILKRFVARYSTAS